MFGKSSFTLDRTDVLGEGAYSTVFKGQWRGIPVAVKRVLNNSSNEREETALLKLDHPNVIKLFHIDSDQDFKHYVLELCKASLDRLFLKDGDPRKCRDPMPPDIEVLQQLAKGLEYIHQMQLIHRNIKPENVLIGVNPHNGQVLMKWSGLETSKGVNERGSHSISGSKRGTNNWYAPEILQLSLLEEEEASGTEAKQRGTCKSDVFAEGLVFGYYLLGGGHPYGSRFGIEHNIIRNAPVNLFNIQKENVRAIIEKMLTANPGHRITSSDVVHQLEKIGEEEQRKYVPVTFSSDGSLSSEGTLLNWMINKFDEKKILGKGDYGKVFLDEFRNEEVAIKRIKLSKVKRHTRREELQRLNHPNVVKLLYVEDDPTYRCFVLELCAASMDQLFSKNGPHSKYLELMPPAEDVLYQLAIGLYYIHETGLIHWDIKPQNVLIWMNPTTNEVVMKWGGLRLCKGGGKIKKNNSTNDWAPELLNLLDNGDSDIIPTVKSNVFAQGLVFGYYLLSGKHVFGPPTQIVYNITANDPVNLQKIQDQVIRDLIKKMLEPNPEKRMTSSDVAEVLEQIRAKERTTAMADDTPNLKQIKVDFKKELGSGGYGTVYQGEWNNNQVAVKQIPLSKVESNKQEEKALQKLNHPNVVKFFYAESDSKNRYYAIELCAASLDKLFLKEKDPKKYRGPMPSKIDVLLQLATGLEYIHKEKVIHRDITHKNILIWVNPENEEVLLKWADFGLSKQLTETGSYTLTKIRGAEGWFAPEILKILNDEDTSRTECQAKQRGTVKSDVFNQGLVFGYYLLNGRHLFGARAFAESNIYHNNPVNLDKIQWEIGRELIKKMIHPDPEKRISSSDVAQELRQINSDSVISGTDKEFDIENKLGEGGFGVVFLGIWRGIPVAVKRIKLTDINNEREENALDKLDHPNVVKLFDVESDSVFKYFYLELCNASLDKLFLKDGDLKKYRGKMPPEIEVLQQLAEGLEYIHQEKLIHRDIKPQNVLIWVDPATQKVLMKWADFGFSKPVNESGSHSISALNTGTNNWNAPEILKIKNQERNGKDETVHQRGTVKSDVYAQGLVFGYYFLNGLHLFGPPVHAPSNILSNKPVHLDKIQPQSVRDLIQKMLEPDPEVRISSSDVFQLLQQLEMKNEQP